MTFEIEYDSPVWMLQASVGLAISTVERSIRDSQQLRRLLHLQVFVLDGVQHALSERLLPELRSPALGEIIVHADNVVPLLSLLVGQEDGLQVLGGTAQDVLVLLLGEIVWRVGTFDLRNDFVARRICETRQQSVMRIYRLVTGDDVTFELYRVLTVLGVTSQWHVERVILVVV